jgi:hypothetical protein
MARGAIGLGLLDFYRDTGLIADVIAPSALAAGSSACACTAMGAAPAVGNREGPAGGCSIALAERGRVMTRSPMCGCVGRA